MAISINRNIHQISETDFHKIDYIITGLAYSIHNDIGRLLDEGIYREILADKCRKAGFDHVITEEAICVSHKNFYKKYYIDLLVEDSILYELKAASALNPNHEKQTLNYLFLTGLQHAGLINFRSSSVQKWFVSTTLCSADRYNTSFNFQYWLNLDEETFKLKELVLDLIRDWGAFLETDLFYEAIVHFNGGVENVLKEIDINLGNNLCGKQKIYIVNEQVAFKITALTKEIDSFEKHLRRFIRITKLKAIQWINFNKNFINFKTILNE